MSVQTTINLNLTVKLFYLNNTGCAQSNGKDIKDAKDTNINAEALFFSTKDDNSNAHNDNEYAESVEIMVCNCALDSFIMSIDTFFPTAPH